MNVPLSGEISHPTLGRVRYQVTEVSDDPDTQVDQTIALMRQYAVEDSQNPSFHQDVYRAWRSDDPLFDTWSYLNRGTGERMMSFVRDETTGAPVQSLQPIGNWRPVVETLIRPADQATLPNPQGDCDDFAMYGAAQLLARGVPCAYCTVAADEVDPTIYSHVYLVAYPTSGPYAGQRVPLDLSHGSSLGWETQNWFGKRKEWPLSGTIGAGMADPALILIGAAGVAALVVIAYQMYRRSN